MLRPPVLRAGVLVTLCLAAVGGTVAAPASAATPTCLGRPATIVGTSGADRINGTAGPDVIVALQGDDAIRAGGGDDLVCAGDGADIVYGGAGDDGLYGQRDRLETARDAIYLIGDVLTGGGGDDVLSPGFDARYDGEPDVDHEQDLVSWSDSSTAVSIDLASGTATGATSGTDTIVGAAGGAKGSAFDDTVIGSDRDETLVPGAGSDVVRAGAGDDTVEVDPASSDGGPADDVAEGGDGDDLLRGIDGDDHLDGQAGDDLVWSVSTTGSSEVVGGPGVDQLDLALPGDDGYRVIGDADDTVVLSRGAAPLRAAVRVDSAGGTIAVDGGPAGTLSGPIGDFRLDTGVRWTFAGSAVSERVEVYAGYPARVNGQGGDDVISGAGGDDALYGGPGADQTHGSAGSDLCRAERKVGCER